MLNKLSHTPSPEELAAVAQNDLALLLDGLQDKGLLGGVMGRGLRARTPATPPSLPASTRKVLGDALYEKLRSMCGRTALFSSLEGDVLVCTQEALLRPDHIPR